MSCPCLALVTCENTITLERYRIIAYTSRNDRCVLLDYLAWWKGVIRIHSRILTATSVLIKKMEAGIKSKETYYLATVVLHRNLNAILSEQYGNNVMCIRQTMSVRRA